MTRYLLITLVFFIVLLPLDASAGKSLDEIVAVVDDDVVLRSELNRAMRSSRRQKGESQQQHKDRVLEALITSRAQKNAAEKAGIKVTDAEVDEAIRTIAARNRITVAQMRQILARQGNSLASLRANIRKQLAERKFHQQMLASQVQVTESEIDDYLSIHGKSGKTRTVNQIRVRQILLRPGEQLSNKEAKTRLTDYRARITNGESFEDIARAYSDDTGSALKGGDLGWINPGQGSPQFRRQVARLKTNQLSQPFQSQFGWHLAQVTDRRKHQSADEAARDAARQKIQQRKIEESLDLLARRLRNQSYVEKRLDGFE